MDERVQRNHATFAQEQVMALLAQIGNIRDNGWTQVAAALRSGDERAAATAS